jgi:hypothetical protein
MFEQVEQTLRLGFRHAAKGGGEAGVFAGTRDNPGSVDPLADEGTRKHVQSWRRM